MVGSRNLDLGRVGYYILKHMLEREGYEIILASNGQEGLDACRNTEVNLVITDLIMPEKEGIETIIALRQSYPDIKIIAISGGGRTDPSSYLVLAQKLGAQKTFDKPVSRKELVAGVQSLLAEKDA